MVVLFANVRSAIPQVCVVSLQPSVNGGECQAGEFCPNASSAPTPCTAGMYCDAAGLEEPTGPCDAGWYCPTGAVSARQVVCDQGYYCPLQSALPEPCR